MAARYAQHFLINTHAARRIVDAMNLNPGDRVVEIGPGKGAITALMLEKPIELTAIEIDDPLIALLTKKFSSKPGFRLIHSDVLDVDFSKIETDKVIGNLPYNLTSPIFRRVSEWTGWKEGFFMIQKEVAERVAAKPGDMSLLSVSVQLYYQAHLGVKVPAHLFSPPPKVDSQVLVLTRRGGELFPDVTEQQILTVVKAGFSARRKTLLNSLSAGLRQDKPQITESLQAAQLDPAKRPQELSLQDWYRLTKVLLANSPALNT
jgi:16S rRNA (adenine1518-N6/adenine1519-N6)-dimethyltransferase